MLGERALEHPDLVKRVVDHGHSVALHGYTHARLLTMDPVRTVRELGKGIDAIAKVSGQEPAWFRPAYGELSGGALLACAAFNLRPILWTVGSGDWEPGSNVDSIRGRVSEGIGSGGTVLFHDAFQRHAGHPNGALLAEVLPLIAEDFHRRNLEVVSLRKHLAA
jgi:peptidoglycan/xylan/chitin deacetylase (PgdA/CDA1 family)